jgi:hypothetical protein
METRVIVDHFFAYNDIVIFPSKMLTTFSTFNAKISMYPPFTLGDSDVIIASVQSDFPLTVLSIDSANSIDGLCVLNSSTDVLTYLHASDLAIKSKLVRAVTTLITRDLVCFVPVQSTDFGATTTFLVKNGFGSPVFDERKNAIALSWMERIPDSVTLNSIAKIVASVKTDRCSITLLIPKAVAKALVKTIGFMNEAAGALFITRYTDGGDAVLGINSDYIKEGGIAEVQVPFDVSPITFHSHPDHVTTEYKAFISWPSGQDMRVLVNFFLQDHNQLAHFVVAPEGLWIVSLTYEFQLLIKTLKKFSLIQCGIDLQQAIYEVFTQFDYARSQSTSPLDRHRAEADYTTMIAGFKIGTLLGLVPSLVTSCHVANKYEKYPLFKVAYIRWDRFEDLSTETTHTVEYAPDERGGLSVSIPPFRF